jgi:hypothetical protein
LWELSPLEAIDKARGCQERDRGAMVVFVVICTIAGVVLGLRFNVLVLIPAMLLGAAIAIGLTSNRAYSDVLLALLGTIASLQIGYFIGCVLHAYFSKLSGARPKSEGERK